jgi:hypothetical protein
MTSYMYLNESPNPGAYLGLHVLLPASSQNIGGIRTRAGHPGDDLHGRPAIGALVTLHLPDGRRMIAQVDGGSGHSGKRSPDVHFGLGEISNAASLTADIDWRDVSGAPRHVSLQFKPGWHTVVLGQ